MWQKCVVKAFPEHMDSSSAVGSMYRHVMMMSRNIRVNKPRFGCCAVHTRHKSRVAVMLCSTKISYTPSIPYIIIRLYRVCEYDATITISVSLGDIPSVSLRVSPPSTNTQTRNSYLGRSLPDEWLGGVKEPRGQDISLVPQSPATAAAADLQVSMLIKA